MPRVVKFTFCAAATLMLLAMAACSYDHYGSWSNTSGAAEPPEYSLTCGGYSEMNELEMLGVALGFFAVPIFSRVGCSGTEKCSLRLCISRFCSAKKIYRLSALT